MKIVQRALATLAFALFSTPVVECMREVTESSRQEPDEEPQVVDAKLDPIGKALKMLQNLQAKVIKEEKEQWLLYDQETALCDKKHKALSFLVKEEEMTYREDVAIIEDEKAKIAKSFARIDRLILQVAAKEQELTRLVKNYKNESTHSKAELKELGETVSVIKTAIEILERAKPSFLQTTRTQYLVQALSAMVNASSVTGADGYRLTELLQASRDAEDQDDDDSDTAPPVQTAYTTGTADVLATLNELLETSEQQLRESQEAFTDSHYNFEEMKSNFTRTIRDMKDELEQLKKDQGWHEQREGEAEHDLHGISKTLDIDKDARKMNDEQCMAAATAFQTDSDLRKKEVEALDSAMAALQGATDTSAGVTFLQLRNQDETGDRAMDFTMVNYVRALGNKHQSKALLHLSMRIANQIRHSAANGQDPFEKVKGLIDSMLHRLEQEAALESSKYEVCHKAITENEEQKQDKEADFDRIDTALGIATSELNKVKQLIASLSASIASAEEQNAQEERLRQKMHNAYLQQKFDDQNGLNAVEHALEILRDYYGNNEQTNDQTSQGAKNILTLLEMIQEDLTKSLASLEAEEEQARQNWETSSNEYTLRSAQDASELKSYQSSATQLQQTVDESQTQKDATLAQLQTIHQTLVGLRKQCEVSPAVGYRERLAKMQAEIDGLKQGLAILEGDTVLLQGQTTHRRLAHRSLRGLLRH